MTIQSVMQKIEEGRSQRQIAKELGVSIARVRTFLRRNKLETIYKPFPSRTWSDADFLKAVSSNKTKVGTLRSLGMSPSPGNYETFDITAAKLRADTSHFTGQAHGTSVNKIYSDEEMFKKGSLVKRQAVRRRILKYDLLPYTCRLCDSPPEWKGKPLTLRLDHVNGISDDHRLSNLRFICPNCDSQLDTYCSKNSKRR